MRVDWLENHINTLAKKKEKNAYSVKFWYDMTNIFQVGISLYFTGQIY